MVGKRSIRNDRADEAKLKNGRDRREGMCTDLEFYQSNPMFFTRDISQMNIVGQYRGATVFLISNGPSFGDLDHSLLRKPGVVTFGINNGPASFRPNFWTCVDDPTRFLKSIWLDPYITKFIPMSLFEKSLWDNDEWKMTNDKVGDCPNVIGYRRNEKFAAHRFLKEDTINWGNHKDFGGGRTVLLAALRICFLLGFRKVYLLGVDMKMTEQSTYHFDEQRSKGAVKGNMNTYKRIKDEYMPELKPIFDAEGFEVFNCNPNSGLTCFPIVSYEDAIKDATAILGDVDNERTWGMYNKPEEKGKWKQEPPDDEKTNTVRKKPPFVQEQKKTPVVQVSTSNNMSTSMVQEVIERAKQKEFAAQQYSEKPSVKQRQHKEPSIEQILKGHKIDGTDVRVVKIQNVDNDDDDNEGNNQALFPEKEDINQTVGTTILTNKEFEDDDMNENMCIDDEPDDD